MKQPTSPKLRPKRSERVEGFIRSRPWLSVASVATVIGLLTQVLPGLLWVKGYFQTTEEARSQEVRLTTLYHAGEAQNAKRDAWSAYNTTRVETVLLRNRVNECEEKIEARALRPKEIAACKQYTREFDAATAKLNKLYDKAIALGEESGAPTNRRE